MAKIQGSRFQGSSLTMTAPNNRKEANQTLTSRSIDVKVFFWSRFYVFNVFLFSKRFLLLKNVGFEIQWVHK